LGAIRVVATPVGAAIVFLGLFGFKSFSDLKNQLQDSATQQINKMGHGIDQGTSELQSILPCYGPDRPVCEDRKIQHNLITQTCGQGRYQFGNFAAKLLVGRSQLTDLTEKRRL
jgi:hypothetical protein